MPGHASAPEVAQPHGGAVEVRRAGEKALSLVDARQPSFTAEEVAAAEARLVKRTGPLVALALEKVEQSWQDVRAELNRLAGGQASARVMVLAHHALRAHSALELQSMLAKAAVGEESDSAERQLRNQAGLSIVASDSLNKAYAQAIEEGKSSKGSLTDQLMARIGATPATGESSQVVSPFDGGGGSSLGPPSPNSTASNLVPPPKDSE